MASAAPVKDKAAPGGGAPALANPSGAAPDSRESAAGSRADTPSSAFIFLTDATFKILNIDKGAAKHGSLYCIPKKLIMDDIQVRAAISDFHPLKAALVSYPEEEILLRYTLSHDVMNMEVCISPEARERFRQAEVDPETAKETAKEEQKVPKEWKSLGSEKEIVVEVGRLGRERIIIKATRKFRDFYAPHKFVDRDALESWSSSQMEVRPAKDLSFDKSLAEQDYGIQAVPVTKTVGTQTFQERQNNNYAQYEPRELDEKRKADMLCSEDMLKFLKEAKRMQASQTHASCRQSVATFL